MERSAGTTGYQSVMTDISRICPVRLWWVSFGVGFRSLWTIKGAGDGATLFTEESVGKASTEYNGDTVFSQKPHLTARDLSADRTSMPHYHKCTHRIQIKYFIYNQLLKQITFKTGDCVTIILSHSKCAQQRTPRLFKLLI